MIFNLYFLFTSHTLSLSLFVSLSLCVCLSPTLFSNNAIPGPVRKLVPNLESVLPIRQPKNRLLARRNWFQSSTNTWLVSHQEQSTPGAWGWITRTDMTNNNVLTAIFTKQIFTMVAKSKQWSVEKSICNPPVMFGWQCRLKKPGATFCHI